MKSSEQLSDNDISKVGSMMTSYQLVTILQTIYESSAVRDKIDFTPTTTSSTLKVFIQRALSLESIQKIQFGVINVESNNKRVKSSLSSDRAFAEEQQDEMLGEHWVSYVQIPSLFDEEENVIGVRSIILNSAGESYNTILNEIKSKIEEICEQHSIQITLSIKHLDYQKQDLEQYQDWNTCGIWACNFFEQAIEKVARAESLTEIKFDEIIQFTDIAQKRQEYRELLKALDDSTNSIAKSNFDAPDATIEVDLATILTNKKDKINRNNNQLDLYVEKLKQVIIQDKFNFILQVDLFENIAKYYLNNNEYIYATAIYNYLINFIGKHNSDLSDVEEKIIFYQKQISEIEITFIKSLGGIINNEFLYLQANRHHKNELENLRQYIKENIKDINNSFFTDVIPGVIEDEELLEGSENIYRSRAEKIISVQRTSQAALTSLLNRFIKEALVILGPVPRIVKYSNTILEAKEETDDNSGDASIALSHDCSFAFIGMGSFSRGEITPWSDLEFAILVEKETPEVLEYFKNLTLLIWLKVINLGETILPSVAIPAFNDFYNTDTEKNWFYDEITPRGFSFDGMMPWASKTPLGRKETFSKPKIELIKTPENMVKFQNEAELVKEGYHLAEILVTVKCIGGSKDGRAEKLVQEYYSLLEKELNLPFVIQDEQEDIEDFYFYLLDRMRIDQYEDSESENMNVPSSTLSIIQRRAIKNLNEIYSQFPLDISPNKQGHKIDVKREIYRLPSLLIESMSHVCKVLLSDTGYWERIDKMYKKGVISYEAKENLKVALSLSAEIRLRTYLFYHSQTEFMSGNIHIMNDKTNDKVLSFVLPNEAFLFRYYITILPLTNSIERFWKDVLSYDAIGYPMKFCYYPLKDTSSVIINSIYIRLSSFEKAFLNLHKAIQTDKSFSYEPALYHLYAHSASTLGNYNTAIEYWKMMLEQENNYQVMPKISLLNNLGSAYDNNGQYDEALSCFKEALDLQKENYVSGNIIKATKDLAVTLNNLGIVWNNLKNKKLSIDYLEKALQIKEKLYKSYPELHIISTLLNLGSFYTDIDSVKSLYYFKRALKEFNEEFGENAIEQQKTHILAGIGSAYLKNDNFVESIELYKKALSEAKVFFKKTQNHPDIINLLYSLNIAYQRNDEHDLAISVLKEALDLLKEGCVHDKTINLLYALGNVYEKISNYQEARNSYEKALEISNKYFGINHQRSISITWDIERINRKESDQHELVLSPFNSIALQMEGVAALASKNYKRAIDIYEHLIQFNDNSIVKLSTFYLLKCYKKHLEEITRLNDIENIKDIEGKVELQFQRLEILETSNLIWIEHAIFLMKCGKTDKAVYLLERIVANERTEEDNITIFSNEYIEDVPDVLKLVISELKMIRIDTSFLSYYLLIEIYSEKYKLLIATSFSQNDTSVSDIGRHQNKDVIKLSKEYIKANHLIFQMKEIYDKGLSLPQVECYLLFLAYNMINNLKLFVHNTENIILDEVIDLNLFTPYIHEFQQIYMFYCQLASENYKNNNLEETIKEYRLALMFTPEGENKLKISISHSLGCMYHVLAIRAKEEYKVDLANEYYQKAEESFKQAIILSEGNANIGLYTEYANFLIQNQRYNEALTYLTQVITSTTNLDSSLSYGHIEKVTVSKGLQKEIDFYGEVNINDPRIFAYYLLISTQIKLGNIEQANDLASQFKVFMTDSGDSLSYSLLGYSYKALERFAEAAESFEHAVNLYQTTDERAEYTLALENQALCFSMISSSEVVRDTQPEDSSSIYFMKPLYNNLFINYPEILVSIYKIAGKKAVNLFLELVADIDIAELLFETIQDQGIEKVLSTLFAKQTKDHAQKAEVQENIDDSILPRIEQIEQLIGEKEVKELVGFTQYVMNALFHNQFTASAKQVIKIMSDLAHSFEELLDVSLNTEDDGVIPYDSYITAVWTQLAYFFEYVESGQRVIGFMSRPPYFDPDPNNGPGGGSPGENSGADNNDNSNYALFLTQSNINFMGNSTSYLENDS